MSATNAPLVEEDGKVSLPPSHDEHSTNLYKERQGHLLSWNNLRVEGNKKKLLLDNIQGKTRPGKLTAIMGHSGSGKTTLLKALTGRLDYSGEIAVDGVQMEASFRKEQKIAFVAQTDSLDLYSTVHEIVEFSARLRLPKYKSEAAIQQLVGDILKDLKLDRCVETQSRHLSGGEKRRLSIGVELVTRPSVIVLDEPTSGLDSYNATMILECLKQVGASGATVLLSIHHPNLQMFQTLDHVILLHGGRCLLQSSVANIREVFENRGLPVPLGTNPADWMLEVSQRHEPEVLEKEYGFFDSAGDSNRASSTNMSRHLSASLASNNNEAPKDRSCAYFQELGLLLSREWKRRRRARMATFLTFAMPVGCSLLMGFVFQGVAQDDLESLTSFQSHVGALFFNLLSAIIVAPGIMMDFVDQRPLFEREYRTNHYALTSYALSKAVADAVVTLVQCILVTLTSFWTIGFQGRAWYFVIVYWSFAYSLVSLSLMMGAIVTDLSLAKEFIGLAIFPQTLLSGFFVSVTDLPNWLQWTPYIIPLTYAFRLASESEFSFCGVPSGRDEDLLKCLAGLEDVFEDTVSYGEQSVMTLAQTGQYKGRDGIDEYTRLTTSSSNPGNHALYGLCAISDSLNIMVNEVSPSKCNITTSNFLSISTNPAVTKDSHVSVETIFGWQVVYNVLDNETLVDEQHLYVSNPFFDFFAGDIDEELVSEKICETLANSCDAKYYHFGNQSECVAAMTTLPVREVNSHGYHVGVGNSTSCRFYHSLMAVENPDLHCAHVSLPPQEDPTGNYKCDDRTRDDVYFNFSTDEWKMFQRHAVSVGIDEDSYARTVPSENRRECVEISASTILETLADANEFADLNLLCYGFLDTNDAKADMVGIYWIATFVFILSFRAFGALALRYQSLRQK